MKCCEFTGDPSLSPPQELQPLMASTIEAPTEKAKGAPWWAGALKKTSPRVIKVVSCLTGDMSPFAKWMESKMTQGQESGRGGGAGQASEAPMCLGIQGMCSSRDIGHMFRISPCHDADAHISPPRLCCCCSSCRFLAKKKSALGPDTSK